ncbi:MAG: hypothetical protein R3282_06655 [Rhodothermales bacterium]|nr:hypothetical protein [Rhodothermales bacterium]
MQFLFDNIVASIVGAVILLMMVATHHRNQLASAEATSYYMLQQQVLDFTATIQRDMQNVSSVQNLTEDTSGGEGFVGSFSFRAQTSPTDTTKRLVTYRRKVAGSRYRKGQGNVTFYQIERFVEGNITGGSIGTLTDWGIQVLNEEGNPASTVGDAKQIRVALAAATPVDVEARDGVTIRDTRWQSTFRPRMLRDSAL